MYSIDSGGGIIGIDSLIAPNFAYFCLSRVILREAFY
jgi:hypothetical protein